MERISSCKSEKLHKLHNIQISDLFTDGADDTDGADGAAGAAASGHQSERLEEEKSQNDKFMSEERCRQKSRKEVSPPSKGRTSFSEPQPQTWKGWW